MKSLFGIGRRLQLRRQARANIEPICGDLSKAQLAAGPGTGRAGGPSYNPLDSISLLSFPTGYCPDKGAGPALAWGYNEHRVTEEQGGMKRGWLRSAMVGFGLETPITPIIPGPSLDVIIPLLFGRYLFQSLRDLSPCLFAWVLACVSAPFAHSLASTSLPHPTHHHLTS